MILIGLLQSAWSSRTIRRSLATLFIVGIAGDQIIKYVDQKNENAVQEFRRGQDAIVKQIEVVGEQNTERHQAVMQAITSMQGSLRVMDERIFKLYQDQKSANSTLTSGDQRHAGIYPFPSE